jgi:TonB family protein
MHKYRSAEVIQILNLLHFLFFALYLHAILSSMKFKNILLVVFSLIGINALAQNGNTGDTVKTLYHYVDQMPIPDYVLNKYLSDNMRYPDSARDNDIQGRVVVKFVVNEDGSISDCTIAKSVSWDCDSEAIRVVKNMPAWKPGMQDGKAVKVYFTLPITYTLQDNAPGKKDTVTPPKIYNYVEQVPRENYDINKYLNENLHYPVNDRDSGFQGRVIVKFVVNEDGSVSDCKVIRGVSKGCDSEALRVVKNMPPWKPGKQDGKPVKVYFTMPIVFKLE